MEKSEIKSSEMIYNKITLSFPEQIEKLFRTKYYIDSIAQVRIALLLVMFLYGMFGILDSMIFPQYAHYFFAIRFFVVIPLSIVVILLSYTKVFQKVWQFLLLVCFIVGGSGIIAMTMFEPENYAYYAGMMLVIFSGYLFLKIRFFVAAIGGWSMILIFNLIALFYVKASSIVIISNNFFFVSANLVGMFAAYFMELKIRQNFFLNQKLDEEKVTVEELNVDLEKKIEKRTKELIESKNIAEEVSANIAAIIEGTFESIWAFDTGFRILYINQTFQREFFESFGVRLEPGVNLIESLPEPLQAIWKSRYDRVLENEQFTVEDAVQTEGGIVYIQVGFNPIIRQGKVVGGSCFGRDITFKKLAELEIIEAKEKAEESDRLKSAFLANMSHEIRTPMNGILGFSELLKEPSLSGEEQRQYIEIIEKSGNRMLGIINDIVDISKIEAGLMEINIEKVDIKHLIDYVFSFFKLEAESKGLKLSAVEPELKQPLIIKTDREKLYAVLINLVKNAIKYTDDGSIEFGYEYDRLKLKFFVKDTGIGIADNRQKAIFERFIQADLINKMPHQGAGLGLSISKAFIEMLDGDIWVESAEDEGSTFFFLLPFKV
ncbi:histidine kinase dimerization/phospho-acceptor domain-containing protein [Carboxylicivirga sp. N1Y90]|uniref:PAS domain-containing sensor histidine kinase n=1 Tax=Carboxylicivirga fragile TaxID=3417571 RepID=UPI003D34D3D9|nr:PAS domain-containing protein [Marinilabiliaceae bacterium N1Y90]